MKSTERVETQRDWFWAMSQELERQADETGDANKRALSESFAVITGALDWVLADELTPEQAKELLDNA